MKITIVKKDKILYTNRYFQIIVIAILAMLWHKNCLVLCPGVIRFWFLGDFI